jgi:NADH-quinone oxidoreductase subunit G
MALLAHELLKESQLPQELKNFFDALDLGYLEAESNVGDDELSLMSRSFARAQKRVLVVGSDVFAHARAKNIAKLAALIEKYTDFSLVVVPNNLNTLGVSLLCDLEKDDATLRNVVGYNANGDFIISSLDDADLSVGALNQQEGTVVSIDKRVLPLNVALAFEGYTLNDIANALGVEADNTIDYTKELDKAKGFQTIDFDSLENFLSPHGEDIRGYILDEVACLEDESLEDIAELPEYNGTVVYHANPVLQFNRYTAKTKQLEQDTTLRGSAQFAAAAKIEDGDKVEIHLQSGIVKRVFKVDEALKGTVALNPTFDIHVEMNGYRFEKSKIVRVV